MAQPVRSTKMPHDARTSVAHSARHAPPRLSLRDRYSMFVGTMKMLLPALAAALILLIVAWPQFTGEEKKFRLGVAKLGTDQLENLSMLNARFDGVDKKNQPFTLTADVATQSRESENLIELELPKADMTMADGTWLALTARAGEFDREARLLRLSGAVSLFHDEGFEMQTSEARIDLANSIAEGDQPIEGQGATGTIQAEGFRILDRGQRIIFTGRSYLTLLPEGREALP
jgi:lipopolysaccharide export system protein LptC